MLKTMTLTASALIVGIVLQPSQANAWCDKDCRDLCRLTAGCGWKGTTASCITNFQCSQYKGQSCEPARVKARARQYNKAAGC